MLAKKKVFYSFYHEDSWRVNQIRNIGVVEGQQICTPNEWEEIKQKGDSNIKQWINKNMSGRDCVIVLIGEKTHTRRWVKYEVKRAKELKIPVFGIFIHKLKDKNGNTSKHGKNVFDIPCYEPNLKEPYTDIRNNLQSWINKSRMDIDFLTWGLCIIVGILFIVYANETQGLT